MEAQLIASAFGEVPSDGDAQNQKQKHRAGNVKSGSAYPSGKRLRPNEQEDARKNAPCSKSSGETIWRGYNSHDGCRSNDYKHVHGGMNQTGGHRGSLMRLEGIGWLPRTPTIHLEEVGGYVRAIRDKQTPSTGPLDSPNPSFANAGNDVNPPEIGKPGVPAVSDVFRRCGKSRRAVHRRPFRYHGTYSVDSITSTKSQWP